VQTTYRSMLRRDRRRRARARKRNEEGKMTTEQYLATPESLLPSELAYGVLRVAEAPAVPHQRLVGRLYLAMVPFVEERQLGEVLLAPTDVVLDHDRDLVVQPDLVFVSRERADIVLDHVTGAPDLAVEILSPHPRVGDLNERVGWFAKYGVRECWIAHIPKRQYAILTLGRAGVVDRHLCEGGVPAPSAVLPGFVLPRIR
jgi:Uma2 family endonuclease